ncbi:MAG: GIY-YIG nuclease family protein [Mycobacterium leprae]
MDKRELKRMARETKTEAGVYQIRNTKNGKRFVDSTPNLKSLNGQRFMLETGSHKNSRLQADWKAYGGDAFLFEVLEVLERAEDESIYFDLRDELKKLEEKWLDRLQPFGEAGYNAPRQMG